MRWAFLVGTTLLVGPVSAVSAQEVTYDYERSVDFSRLKTYAWVDGTVLRDELNHRRIMEAVDRQLAAKGLRRVEADATPDVLVAYHALFDQEIEIHGLSSGWGGYRWGSLRSGSARVEEILVGTLAVDVVDAKTRSTIWRGMATKNVDLNAEPEKREKNLNKATEKLFKNYPPKNRGKEV